MNFNNNFEAATGASLRGAIGTTVRADGAEDLDAPTERPVSPPPFSHELPDYRAQPPLELGPSTFKPAPVKSLLTKEAQQQAEQAKVRQFSERLALAVRQSPLPDFHQVLGALAPDTDISRWMTKAYGDAKQGALAGIPSGSARELAARIFDYVTVLCGLCEPIKVPGIDDLPASLVDEVQDLHKSYEYHRSVAAGMPRPKVDSHMLQSDAPGDAEQMRQAQHHVIDLMLRKNVITLEVAQALRSRLEIPDEQAREQDSVSIQAVEQLVRARERRPQDPLLANVCVSQSAPGNVVVYFQSAQDFARRVPADLSLHLHKPLYGSTQIAVRLNGDWIYDQATKHEIIADKLSAFEAAMAGV